MKERKKESAITTSIILAILLGSMFGGRFFTWLWGIGITVLFVVFAIFVYSSKT